MRIYTGYNDRFGKPIFTGDIVKFKCLNCSISGRGIVAQAGDNTFEVQDNRTESECKSRNVGRIYPFYDDAIYTIVETQAEREE